MNQEQVKADENLLCGLELPQYNVSVYLLYRGSEDITYYMFYQDALLFHGHDFRPSPLYNVDSLECISSLLNFLTTAPGQVDQDFFAKYSPEQLAWTETADCEALSGILADFGNTGYDTDACIYHNIAKDILLKGFITG